MDLHFGGTRHRLTLPALDSAARVHRLWDVRAAPTGNPEPDPTGFDPTTLTRHLAMPPRSLWPPPIAVREGYRNPIGDMGDRQLATLVLLGSGRLHEFASGVAEAGTRKAI
jgi:hypothetical protein